MRALIVSTGLLVALSALGTACGSRAGTLCDLVCECEHCNDYTETFTCDTIETSLRIAEAYGCESEWESYADCVEQKGTCDAKEVRFTTAEPGSCTSEYDAQIPCVGDAECAVIGSATCVNGSCHGKACTGSGQPCSSDGECTGNGADRCATEAEALSKCEADSSDDPTLGIGFADGPSQGN